jgi:hypothetical protein
MGAMSITTFKEEPQLGRTTKFAYAYSPDGAMRVLQMGTREEFQEFFDEIATDTNLLKQLLTSFFNLDESVKTAIAAKSAKHVVRKLEMGNSWAMFLCGLLVDREFSIYEPAVNALLTLVNQENLRMDGEICKERILAAKQSLKQSPALRKQKMPVHDKRMQAFAGEEMHFDQSPLTTFDAGQLLEKNEKFFYRIATTLSRWFGVG